MTTLEIIGMCYLVGWAATATQMALSMLGRLDADERSGEWKQYTERHPVIARVSLGGAFLVTAIAIGSVWPAILLVRIGILVWHHAGHPGARDG